MSKKITVDKFIKQFNQLEKSNMDASKMRKENFERKIDFQRKLQSPGFTKKISSLDKYLELFDLEIDFDMNLKNPDLIGYGISKEFLRSKITDNFLPRISKYCRKY